MQDDEALLLDVIDAHLTEAPLIVDQLGSAIKSGDAAGVRRLAHTIKGNLRALHAREPIVAAELEADGAHGDLSRAEPLFEAIQRQLDAVNEELRTFVRAKSPANS